MKILIIGDLHIGLVWDGLDRTDAILGVLENVVVKYSPDIDVTVYLGDIFENSHPTPKQIGAFLRILQMGCPGSLKGTDNPCAHILKGNHDGDLNSVKGSAVAPLSYFHTHVVTETESVILPMLLSVKGGTELLSFLSLPYSKEDSSLSILTDRAFVEAKDVIVFSHLDIPGAVAGVEQYFTKARPTQLSGQLINHPKIKRIFAGHVHKPQTVGDKITVVGSLVQCDLTEVDDQKRVVIYDTETDTITNIPVQTPEFGGTRLKRISLDFTANDLDVWKTYESLLTERNDLTDLDILSVDIRVTEEDYPKLDLIKLEESLKKQVHHIRRIVPVVVRNREMRLPTLNVSVDRKDAIKSYVETYCKQDGEDVLRKSLEIVETEGG
jgi:DNA repair exonuclease SbcCD nuclease subunit